MSDAVICDNCRTVLTDRKTFLRLLEPDPEAERNMFGMLDMKRHDLCSWKCAAEYTYLRVAESEVQRDA